MNDVLFPFLCVRRIGLGFISTLSIIHMHHIHSFVYMASLIANKPG